MRDATASGPPFLVDGGVHHNCGSRGMLEVGSGKWAGSAPVLGRCCCPSGT